MNQTVQDETFTKVPNELLEMLARARLSGREHQVLLALIRKTCGFHKKADKISLSQFSKATGISRNHCQEILSRLSDRRIVYLTVPNGGNRAVRMYRINCKTHEWQVFPKTGTAKKKRRNPENGNSLSPKTGTDHPEIGNRTCSRKREQQKKEKKLFKESFKESAPAERKAISPEAIRQYEEWLHKQECDGVALGPFEGDQAPPATNPEEKKAALDAYVKRSLEYIKRL